MGFELRAFCPKPRAQSSMPAWCAIASHFFISFLGIIFHMDTNLQMATDLQIVKGSIICSICRNL